MERLPNDTAFSTRNNDQANPESSPTPGLGVDCDGLFKLIAHVLALGALRLKPRERQFAALLSSESFGNGSESGEIGISTPVRGKRQTGKWCRSLGWRPAEIWNLFDDWRRAGWIVVDEAEGRFRLCPDNLAGWNTATRLLTENRDRVSQKPLALDSGDGLGKEIAKISQTTCGVKEIAKISQSPGPSDSQIAKFSQSRGGWGGPTFKNLKALEVQDLKLKDLKGLKTRAREGEDCENFAISGAVTETVAGYEQHHWEMLKTKLAWRNVDEALSLWKILLGDDVYERDGGKWRNRLSDPAQKGKVRRVQAAFIETLQSGKVIEKPGGHAETLWKDFN